MWQILTFDFSLLDGWTVWQHQPYRIWRSICLVHSLHDSDVLLYRSDGAQVSSLKNRSGRHQSLPYRADVKFYLLILLRPLLVYGALAMGACHFIVGGLLSAGETIPGGVGGNPNIPIQLTGGKANAVIAFSYLLIIVYALTLAPVCWIYAAEVWSLETRAVGMSIASLGEWFSGVSHKSHLLTATKAIGSSTLRSVYTSRQASSTSSTECSSSSE